MPHAEFRMPNSMVEVPASECSLHATLASGQTFRWHPQDGWWCGVVGRAILRVRQEGERLLVVSSDPAVTAGWVSRYFALDLDLAAILRSIDVDLQVHQAIERFRGLRVLRQDGWETLASFICASFNNIKRIEGMIERLCQAYGDPIALTPTPFAAAEGGSARCAGPNGPTKGVGVNGVRSFGFPSPEAIANASERQLRSLGLGYRAPYLKRTARLVADGRLRLDQLRGLDYLAARRALLACDGVGEKVADCVALFGCEQYQAFPIDVWIERAMRYYFRHRRQTRARMHAYALRHFGPWAGYAQQYLYHFMRTARASVQRGASSVQEPC